jgi:flagellar motor switch protein FliN/FliY
MIPTNAFAELCAQTAASLLNSALGGDWQVELAPAADREAGDNRIWVRFTANRDLTGELAFVVAAREATVLAQRFMGEPVGTGELTADHREAIDELFRQLTGQLATALKSDIGEVELRFLGGEAPAWTPAGKFLLNATTEGLPPLSIDLWLDPAIATALGPGEAFAAKSESDPAQSPVTSNLDLLMEVELPVTLRFGQRQMRLSEVVDLASGAVIELDRHVQDPVDLLVDGKVVARGEVVVVDGNYGLRVTEVAPPGQRIRCFA